MGVISKIVECPYCGGSGDFCDYCDQSGLLYEWDIARFKSYENQEDDED